MSQINFKNRQAFKGMVAVGWHPILESFMFWWLVRHQKGKTIVTDGFRPGDKGVHGTKPLRALDIRSRVYEDPEKAAGDANSKWLYDPKRPYMKVVVYHARCPKCEYSNLAPYHGLCNKCDADISEHWHFHFQVHPRTQYFGDGIKDETNTNTGREALQRPSISRGKSFWLGIKKMFKKERP